MEWTFCLLPLILSVISRSLAFVEIFQQNKNWFEASNECVNRGGNLVHPNELYLRNCSHKSINVWVDTNNQERLTPWIANMGCFVTTKLKISRPSLLECYRLCKSTPFGYQEPWCTCEEELLVDFVADSPCSTQSINGNNGNFLWLYNKTEVDLSDDDYRMDCITAMCKENSTIFRAINCGENKIVYCQSKDFIIRYNDSYSQANSELTCETQSLHLISKGTYGFCEQNRNTPEFWTGIKRFRYNDTGRLTDRVRCVYVRCQNRSSQDTFKNCRQQLDGFACNISSTSYNVTTVIPRPTSVFASAIISSSDSSSSYIEYVSSNKPQQHTAKSTVLIKGKVSMYAQSNKEHASLHTRVISGSSLYHTSKLPASAASLKTSLISTKTNTIDMSTVVYSSFVTNNHKIELIENNSMHGTTTRNLNRSKVHQSRIGVFVGVSVTILVAMIVGLFITCRLRHLGPFKEKAEDYTNPITKTANPNYHDIDFDLEKETNFIDNASKNNVLEIKCDDIKFKATYDTTNGKTNSHNNTYAVVEKNRIPDAIKKEENQDKDENRSSNVESDYYSLNQPRRISGDESSNIYDTSNGNMDDIDPTYNTTTDVHAIERTNASDYDHL